MKRKIGPYENKRHLEALIEDLASVLDRYRFTPDYEYDDNTRKHILSIVAIAAIEAHIHTVMSNPFDGVVEGWYKHKYPQKDRIQNDPEYIQPCDGRLGVLPMVFEDGGVISCCAISGGARYVDGDLDNGFPDYLSLVIRSSNGTERYAKYSFQGREKKSHE